MLRDDPALGMLFRAEVVVGRGTLFSGRVIFTALGRELPAGSDGVLETELLAGGRGT